MKPIKLLLVDDESIHLDLSSEFLRKEDKGFVVDTATSAEEALDLIEEKEYDCIVSDYQMPSIDGLEFLERVRNELDTPFIMFTGKGREEVAMEALNLGADRYIQKGGDVRSQFGVLSDAIKQEVRHYRTKERERELEALRRTVREVNQVLTKGRNLVETSKKVCDALLETKGYLDISIALEVPAYDSEGSTKQKSRVLKPVASCGDHDRKEWELKLDEDIKSDLGSVDINKNIPECFKQVIETREELIIESKKDSECCTECEFCLYDEDHSTVKIPIKLKERLGILSFCLETDRLNENELTLLREVAKDIECGFRRMEIEEALEESEKEKKFILNSLEEIIVYQNKDHEILWANKAAGKSVDENSGDLKGRKCYEVWHDKEEPIEDCPVEKVMKTGEIQKNEIETADGKRYIITGYPILDNGGEVEKVIEIRMDVTEKKKRKKKEDFLHSLLRHDIKNKLQVSLGYTQLLKEDLDSLTEKHERFIGKDWKVKHAVIDLIEKVKKVRKAYYEELKDVDLKAVVNSAVEKYQYEAANRSIKIEIDDELQENDCNLNVLGGELMEEIFSNLVINSIKHSEGSKLRIGATEYKDVIVTTVEDDGKGIPDEEKDKVLKKGYTSGGGSGLGLYFAKEIAESYDGSIEIKDSELGGAKFDITFKKAR